LLQQLCVGPDGADKRNEYDLRRSLRHARDLVVTAAGTPGANAGAAITIAFSAGSKSRMARLLAEPAVTRNRSSETPD
jgi:hypothetical protein